MNVYGIIIYSELLHVSHGWKFEKKNFFQKHKKCSYFNNFGWIWLVNELALTFLAPIKYAKAEFHTIIL